MKFKKAFSFMADDKEWFKKLLGVIWTLFIPVVGQFIFMGYFAKVTKSVIAGGDDVSMPELDIKPDLKRGWKLFLLQLVWMLPFIALAIIMGIFSLIMASVGGDAILTLFTIMLVCLSIIIVLLAILVALLIPVAIANYLVREEFKDGTNIKEIFRIFRKSVKSWLLVFVGAFFTQTVVMLGAPSGLGIIVLVIYAGLAYHHMIGQAYNISKSEQLGEVVL